MQLHESFGPNLFRNLESFIKLWPHDLDLAIEFRHPEWFEHRTLRPEVLQLLEAHRISTVITDVSGRRDVSHSSLSTNIAMIRLVGNSLHPTDFERSDAWLDRLGKWVSQGLEKLYLFAHEPEDVLAMKLGTYWIEALNERMKLNLTVPGIPKEEGNQMSLF